MRRFILVVTVWSAASIGRTARADDVDQARSVLAQMEATAAHIRALLRDARAGRDGAKIACVDEALSRADVSVRSARDAIGAAAAMRARGDAEGARAKARLVAIYRSAVRSASTQAGACASGIDAPEDETVVVVRR